MLRLDSVYHLPRDVALLGKNGELGDHQKLGEYRIDIAICIGEVRRWRDGVLQYEIRC